MTPKITGTNTEFRVFGQLTSVINQIFNITKAGILSNGIVYLLLLPITLLWFGGCVPKSPTSAVDIPSLVLTHEDASCTEAWVRLQIDNPGSVQWLRLSVNDKDRGYLQISGRDTILLIDSLPINKRSTIEIKGSYWNEKHESAKIEASTEVNTLDTTSHNYTFNSWLFGGITGDSDISGVGITPSNEMWVIGNINEADTATGSASGLYTSLVWREGEWRLNNYYFYDSLRNNMSLLSVRSVFVSPKGKVLFTGGSLFSWDGVKANLVFNGLENFTGDIFSFEVVWQFEDGELYGFDTYQKKMMYRKNNVWKYLGTRPETAYGVYGNDRNELIVPAETRILWMEGGKIVNEMDLPMMTVAYSAWFKRKHRIYFSGSGVFRLEAGKLQKEAILGERLIKKIVGTDYNNIWCIGGGGFLAHFNGVSWKVINQVNNNFLQCLAVQNGRILYGGSLGEYALLIMGLAQ